MFLPDSHPGQVILAEVHLQVCVDHQVLHSTLSDTPSSPPGGSLVRQAPTELVGQRGSATRCGQSLTTSPPGHDLPGEAFKWVVSVFCPTPAYLSFFWIEAHIIKHSLKPIRPRHLDMLYTHRKITSRSSITHPNDRHQTQNCPPRSLPLHIHNLPANE